MSTLQHSSLLLSSMLWTETNFSNQFLFQEPMEPAKESKKEQIPVGRSSTSSHMTPLPKGFEPSNDDVVCGRGKKCYTHIGNERFRKLVLTFLQDYSRAKSKVDKSAVLSRVVEEVRMNSPGGGFVKQDAKGVWHEVGDFLAREKTSQAFRDALHERYKSSNISKKKRRQEEQAKAVTSGKTPTEAEAPGRLEQLSQEVMRTRLEGIEDFNRKNYEMLSLQTGQMPPRMSLPDEHDPRRRTYNTPPLSHPSMRSDHFPDPLFGSSGTRFYDREARPQERFDDFPRLRQYSFASAPETSTEPLESQSDSRSLNNSLPDIPMYIRSSGRDVFDEDLSIRSVPDLGVSTHHTGRIELDRLMTTTRDIEPIPLKNIKLPGAKKTDDEMQGVAAAPKKEEDTIPASSVRTAKLSKDLVECLGKLTYHNIAEDALFEPIPFTTSSEPMEAEKPKKATAEGPPTSIHKGIFNRDMMMFDESEHDEEFAEG